MAHKTYRIRLYRVPKSLQIYNSLQSKSKVIYLDYLATISDDIYDLYLFDNEVFQKSVDISFDLNW